MLGERTIVMIRTGFWSRPARAGPRTIGWRILLSSAVPSGVSPLKRTWSTSRTASCSVRMPLASVWALRKRTWMPSESNLEVA